MTRSSMNLDFPINAEIAFTDAKGRHRPRWEKKQRKVLARAAPLLEKVLEPGEEIQLATVACSPYSVLEFLTTGWLIVYVKRCLLVVTDRRLLHLPTTHRFTPKNSIAQTLYGDVDQLKVSAGLGHKLAVTFRDGSKETFSGFPGWVAKKLKVLLPERSGQGQASAAGGRQYLCPRCAQVLAADAAHCAGCGLAFRDKKTALKYSLLFPGGGYFYTRHPWLGAADAFVEALLLLFVILGVVWSFGPDGDPAGLAVAAIYGVFLALEKLITVYHAQHYVKDRIPVERNLSIS